MQAADLPRATAAAASVVSALGLAVDDTVVLHDSNRLTVRLVPCDALARVAYGGEDQLPNGPRAARILLDAVGQGPPWPTLDTVMPPR